MRLLLMSDQPEFLQRKGCYKKKGAKGFSLPAGRQGFKWSSEIIESLVKTIVFYSNPRTLESLNPFRFEL